VVELAFSFIHSHVMIQAYGTILISIVVELAVVLATMFVMDVPVPLVFFSLFFFSGGVF